MPSINVHAIAPAAQDWLANSRHPRILHVFDHACNLVNERREILSIVTPKIGNGPFSLVLESDICFSDFVHSESSISIEINYLALGELIIITNNATLWDPRPDWEALHAKRNTIPRLVITNQRESGLDMILTKNVRGYSTTTSLQSLLSNLFSALANNDIFTTRHVTSKLAGLGIGLTPSGDDLLLGAIYAAWIIHPPETASILTESIATTSAPLTTSLSAAYLRAGARGEAGVLWHDLFDALLSGNPSALQLPITNLLSLGHTSGADALTGLIGLFVSWSGVKGERNVNFNAMATGT